MNDTAIRHRLEEERASLRRSVADMTDDAADVDRFDDEQGDTSDRADTLTRDAEHDSILASLTQRIEALDRAERRLDDGTYGHSVDSSDAIDDERLAADAAADVTANEADVDVSSARTERADEI